MLRNSHSKFFPPPTFLAPASFGLDISDESIKFVKLVSANNGIRVDKYGERQIPPGVIESGKIKDIKQLEKIFFSLRKEEGLKSVRVSLPEEQIYLFSIRLEKEGLKDIMEGIELSLEEYVPIPAEEAIFDYELISQDEKSIEVQVNVIPKSVIESYLDIFKNCGISVSSFEPEAQAVARSVIKKGDMETYMIIDFGYKRTGLSIISGGIIRFTSTIDLGGTALTNIIQKNFKVSFEEAEKMKRQYGLQRNVANKEMFSVLLNSVSVLSDEISKHFVYWHTHKDEYGEGEGKSHPPIKKIILCGGDSNLAGLSEYFSINLKHPVEVADVWINIEDAEKNIPMITFNQSLSYASALGLALGDFYL